MDEIDLDDYSDVSLLAILLIGTSENNKIDHKLRIQKLAFLTDKIIGDPELDDDFDYYPHYLGPHSDNLEQALDRLYYDDLIESQKINKSEGSKLTSKGKLLFNIIKKKFNNIYNLCLDLNENLKNLSTNEVVKIVYRLYPDYTKNSLIKDDLVKTNDIDCFSIPFTNNGNIDSLKIESENKCLYDVTYEKNLINIHFGD